MRLTIAAAVLLTGCVVQPPPPPPPICVDPDVLRQVDETLRARGQVLVFETAPIGEVSVAGPRSNSAPNSPPLAHCSMRGHTVGYDTNRYGMTPVHEPFIVAYTIELRHNGMFVSIP